MARKTITVTDKAWEHYCSIKKKLLDKKLDINFTEFASICMENEKYEELFL